ncbi:VCBS repeat-containing protein [Kitasatospora sp. NA04385]|uniref:FG-GAP repeat domain-containing protein n=1 Tax=Kitasatospora sp. NA04385 TaxID=2742135 RepID=UPI001591945B|nr:VCBS repeat-containing protein [Kitasatospora sp. NA04385]QKW19282.1 VCBS repeat-containing protein [Kitasatospora sp. NA04385]
MYTSRGSASRRRSLLAVLATGTLLAAPLAVGTAAAAEPNAPLTAPAPAAQSPQDRALAEAERTGRPVEIPELLDEYDETLANPDGTFTRRSHVEPVRAKVDGAWRTPDATLRARPDGTLAPAAPTFPIVFSGGGTAPLASLTREGHTLAIGWPTALPTPVVDGSTARYPEVLPGVDLEVRADVDGFSEQLVVKTRQAAADPALAELRLLTTADGLDLSTADDGGIRARDRDGRTVFQAPAPTMWDTPAPKDPPRAARAALAADPAGPEPERDVHSARMGVQVEPGAIRITPDHALLTSPDARFPLVIDPVFTGGSRQKWAFTASSYPNSSFVAGAGWTSDNPTDEFRAGYSGDAKHQTYFTVGTGGLKGAQILGATLHTVETHSWGCSASAAGYTDLWVVGAWDHDPTWNWGLPRAARVNHDSFAGGNDTYCPNDLGHDFSGDGLRSWVQQVADNDGAALTLNLAAESSMEGNVNSYKRFKNNPYLEVTYNRAPVVDESAAYEGPWTPGGSGSKPVPCVTDPASWPVVGNNDLVLTAKVSDPDGTNTTAHFGVWKDAGGDVQSFDTVVGSGSWATDTVPANLFQDGVKYRWAAQARDGIAQSATTTQCGFTVDRSAPTAVGVAPADGKRIDVAEVPARVARTLRLTASDSNLAGFCWTLEQPVSVSNTRCQNGTWADAVNGAANVTVTPTSWPNARLHVVAYDKAGNRSSDPADGVQLIATRPADFVRPASATTTPAGHDLPGDLNGDGYPDVVAVSPQGVLRLYPGTGSGVAGTPVDLGGGWAGALVTHRGDLAGNRATTADVDGYEDYVVRGASGPDAGKLFVYPNDGLGRPNPAARRQLVHPTAADWSATTQVLATGDLDGRPGNDLLTVEGGRLYLYSGRTKAGGTTDTTAPFDLAGRTELGAGTDWSAVTLAAPGDLNGDGTADLVARDNRTGALTRYPGRGGGATAYTLGAGTPYGSPVAGRAGLLSLGNIQSAVTTETEWYDANDNGVEEPGERVPYRRSTPAAGQGAPDLLVATPAGGTVTYTEDGSTAKSAGCPGGCLLAYSADTSGPGALPRLAGGGSWGGEWLEGPSALGDRLMRDRTDYDRDGWTDLLARDSAGALWVYPGSGGSGVGTYGTRKLVCSGCGGYPVVRATDLDGDRTADLVMRDGGGTLSLWRGNGTPGDGTNWVGPTRIGVGWNGLSQLDFADLNGDGKVDAVGTDANGDLWLYPGTGRSTADGQLGSPVKIGTGWGGRDVLLGDVDDDGRTDVLAVVQGTGEMYAYRNTGGSGLQLLGDATLVGTGWWPGVHRPQLGDVNNDGLTDILDRDSDGNLWLYPGTGRTGTSAFGDRSLLGWGWQGYETYL